jgi:HEAT repeat protein
MLRTLKPLAATLLVLVAVAVAAAAPPPTRADIDKAVADLAAFVTGQDNAPVQNIAALLQQIGGKTGLQRHAEGGLVRLLEGDADLEAKLQACQILARIGSEACIPVLEKMLADPKTNHMACWALQPNPSAKADAALRSALAATKGNATVCICGVLGHRRDAASVPALAKVTSRADPVVAEAALSALGKIGGADVATILADARRRVPDALRPAATDAYLQCADRLASTGAADAAGAIYKEVLAADAPLRFHRGALLGLMRTAGADAIPFVLKTVRSNDPKMRAAAIANIPTIKGEGVTKRLAAEMPNLPPDAQVLLIGALASRGDTDAGEAVLKAAASASAKVRAAAVGALAEIGDASSVPLLARAAAGAKTDEEKQAALLSLRRLKGDGVDEAVTKSMAAATGDDRAQLIEVLLARSAAGAVPAILKEAGSADETVRKAAFRALGMLAKARDLPALVDLLVGLKGDAGRDDAERTVIEVARKLQNESARADAALAALAKATGAEAKGSLLRVLRGIAGAKALAAVKAAVKDSAAGIQDAAIRALADWPDASAVAPLMEVFRSTESTVHRVVALRGCVRLLGLPGGLSPAETVKAYGDLMALAKRPEDKKLVLAGLAKVAHSGALAVAESCMTDPAIRAEATLAVLGIAKAVMGSAPDAAKAAATKLGEAGDANVKKQARQILAALAKHADYIMGWQVAGVYAEPRKKYQQLFATAFPPEKPNAKVAWRPLPVVTRKGSPIIHNLLGQWNKEQCVAYVRTWIQSDKAQAARLLLGTDDATKVWLNGKRIHQVNTGRACVPDQDKVNIQLKRGWNTLLVKVIQNIGPWEFCARIVARDGSRLPNLRIDATRE